MTSLGKTAYVGTLNFSKLVPPFDLPRKKLFISGYFNNIYQGSSATPHYMEWTNRTTAGSGNNEITPMVFPFKVKLITSTYCWLSGTAMSLTGVERGDFNIGKYVAGAGGVGNDTNFTPLGGTIHQFTSADNGTFPKVVIDNSAGGYEFNAGEAISIRSIEQGTITPTNSELQVSLVFEIID